MVDRGQRIAGYQVLTSIGRGSIGEVFLAETVLTGERVAIKVMEPELSRESKVLEKFFREARTTSQLQHAGIARMVDCFVEGDRAFVVMELLAGETLSSYLKRVGPLGGDLPFILGVGVAVANVAGAVHGARVLHRDLKPGNVFLHLATAGPEVTPKVTDFGIARLSQENDGPSQTASGLLLGTPPYMSPEQCSGRATDGRSDIYSLGCVLYEALCGRPPFESETMADFIVAHLSRTPESLVKRVPDLPGAVNVVVLRMLAKKPEDRPQTMADVVRALRECGRALQVDLTSAPLVPQQAVERELAGVLAGIPASMTAPDRLEIRARPVPPMSPQAARPMRVVTVPGAIASAPALGREAPKPIAGIAGGTIAFDDDPDDADQSTIRGISGGTMILGGEDGLPGGDALGNVVGRKRADPLAPSTPKKLESLLGTRRLRVVAIVAGAAILSASVVLAIFGGSLTPRPQRGRESASTVPTVTHQSTATVEIAIRGLRPNADVSVDGRYVPLPMLLVKGPQLHRIVVHTPDESDRTIDIDARQSRTIDLTTAGR